MDAAFLQQATATPRMIPDDSPNRQLAERVHPPQWPNPDPAPLYDLVVIGGGTAGLVSAVGAAGLGARVALVERHLLGGDCLITGCVPSKALIRSARLVGEVQRAGGLGVRVADVSVDFARVMQRMRERRAAISRHDAAERLQRAGVDVFFGEARFVSQRAVIVDGARLTFSRAVIATGSRPTAPPVAGLDQVPYLTNETLFSLTELPRRLLIIGAGPIGCEMAQAFVRFGSAVTVFDQAPQVLPREDADAASIVKRRLEAGGIRFQLGVRLDTVVRDGGELAVHYTSTTAPHASGGRTGGDVILVAAGRAPNVESLKLAAAGVRSDEQGVVVNDRLQTSNRRIFAAGDVCSVYKFTHAADAMARVVLQNALFFGRRKASALVIPWVTFTDPEVAHVGVAMADAGKADGRIETITVALADVDRAVVDDDVDGFVRVHHERGRIRGCTIVASNAGEMIAEAVFAMTHGGTLADLSATVHPYPTQTEALRKAGDAYQRSRLSPALKQWFTRYFNWTR